MTVRDDRCLAAALDYLARGWSVIPVAERGKRPLIRWQPYQGRRASPAEAGAWFGRWPGANVGIVTGAVSGLVVLDVDPHHEGEASLAALARAHAPLLPTLEACTGGGGRHLYFAHPGGHVANRAGLAPGLDLRGDGGFVVAPPSRHASGRRYAWVSARQPGVIAPAPLPEWLFAAAVRERRGHGIDYWRALLREGVVEGVRNNTLASLAGHLLWHGVDAEEATELLLCWNRVRCRPPLQDDEVVRTVQSIARLHGAAD